MILFLLACFGISYISLTLFGKTIADNLTAWAENNKPITADEERLINSLKKEPLVWLSIIIYTITLLALALIKNIVSKAYSLIKKQYKP